MVTDLGVAKIFDGVAASASQAVGTPGYMAPEQILAGRLSPATDLYTLGVVLYRLRAGVLPFDPEPRDTLLQRCLTTTPAPPAGVPAPITEVIIRAWAKDRSHRRVPVRRRRPPPPRRAAGRPPRRRAVGGVRPGRAHPGQRRLRRDGAAVG